MPPSYLNLHMPQIKNLKLSMTNSQGQSVASVDLKRQSDLRPSHAAARLFAGRGLTDQSSVDDEINIALKEVGKMAQKTGEVLSERLVPPDREFMYLKAMAKSLDFTQMISDGAQDYCSELRAKPQLEQSASTSGYRRASTAAARSQTTRRPSTTCRPLRTSGRSLASLPSG